MNMRRTHEILEVSAPCANSALLVAHVQPLHKFACCCPYTGLCNYALALLVSVCIPYQHVQDLFFKETRSGIWMLDSIKTMVHWHSSLVMSVCCPG
uniref:Uncharacterized protein n=1 Tax=Arundo donax TaxID=35708 RepID=A0A0A9GL47_ARUDO